MDFVNHIDINGFVIGVALVVILLVSKALFGKQPIPPTKSFRCARCSTVEEYGPRTLEAWRKGIKKLYCQNCHRTWLNQQPNRIRATSARGSGCASVTLVTTLIPPMLYALIKFMY